MSTRHITLDIPASGPIEATYEANIEGSVVTLKAYAAYTDTVEDIELKALTRLKSRVDSAVLVGQDRQNRIQKANEDN